MKGIAEKLCGRGVGVLLGALAAALGGGCCPSPRLAAAGPLPPPSCPAPARMARIPAREVPPPRLPAADAALRAKMDRIVIPSIEFRQAPVEEVIRTLIELGREHDPAGEGINIIYLPGRPAADPESGPPVPVSMLLRGVSLREALDLSCLAAGLRWRPDSGRAVVTPAGAPEGPMETRIYGVHPSLVPMVTGAADAGPVW